MKHLTKILTLLLAFLMVMTVISPLAACDKTPEQTPDTTACDTDPVTEAPTEEIETHRPTREDWDESDPQNPYYNLIQVGTAFDGKTPVYDGRYEFDHVICHTSDGAEFYSMQDALDWLEGYGGNIQMDADPNICLKLDIPDDGCFYRIAYCLQRPCRY